MKTKEEYEKFIKDAFNVSKTARENVIEILKEKGPIEFDWDNCDAPSIPSTQFEDDLADSYITKIWYDGLIKVNLHAYYLGEDLENIDLGDETCVDWVDLLEWVVSHGM